MTILTFVNTFNLIKPKIEEIGQTDGSLSADILVEIYKEYDLRILSMELYDDFIIDLLINTNICELSFSVFHFDKIQTVNDKVKIGSIEEKGHLYFDKTNQNISFSAEEVGYSKRKTEMIDQINFAKFILKYLECDFNRVFRANKPIIYTKDILLNYDMITKFPIAEVLLNEIDLALLDLLD